MGHASFAKSRRQSVLYKHDSFSFFTETWCPGLQALRRHLTYIIFAIEVTSMASIHPPPRSVLLSTVAFVVVIVVIMGTEPHAIVVGVGFITWVIPKIVSIKGIPSVTPDEVGISQSILVLFTSHSEYSVVSSAVNKGQC